MNTDTKEHLSQLMDGEIGGETGRFVLRRLEASAEWRDTWARYHLIRDCLRYQDRGLAGDELCARVRRALQSGPRSGDLDDDRPSTPRWLKPVGGFAVAAAVALMAVIAVAPNLPENTGAGTQQASVAESQPFTSPNIPNSLSRGPLSNQVSRNGGDEAAARKLNSYLLRHYQVAGSSGGSGFVSFVPIVISKSTMEQPTPEEAEAQPRSEQDTDSETP